MRQVDLNADLGERAHVTALDRRVIDAVTSVSIACGFHAGSPEVMRDTAAACHERGVVVGAHVAYRDRAGFGRRPVEVGPEQLAADLEEQCGAMARAAAEAGTQVRYLKPHGALYHAMSDQPQVGAVVVTAAGALAGGILVAPGASPVADLAVRAGVRVVREGFPDRGYLPDGRLAPRDMPGAVVTDAEEAAERACSLARRGGVHAVDGRWVEVDVDTLCIHGDTPDADRRARAVRAALDDAGVLVRSFVADRPAPGAG